MQCALIQILDRITKNVCINHKILKSAKWHRFRILMIIFFLNDNDLYYSWRRKVIVKYKKDILDFSVNSKWNIWYNWFYRRHNLSICLTILIRVLSASTSSSSAPASSSSSISDCPTDVDKKRCLRSRCRRCVFFAVTISKRIEEVTPKKGDFAKAISTNLHMWNALVTLFMNVRRNEELLETMWKSMMCLRYRWIIDC